MSIRFENVSFAYKKVKSPFQLHNLNFVLNADEKICIHGKTGAGKTTLFRLLLRDLAPGEGKIFLDDLVLPKEKNLYKKVSFIFQKPEDQFIFPVINDEFEFITEDQDNNNILQNISKLCKLFNVTIENFLDRDLYSVSIGELRLLQIIFALSMQSKYLILDEPTTFLDHENQIQFLTHIKKIKDKGVLILTKHLEIYSSIVERNISLISLQS
ncbi:MAG TPA: ABC transporter ATP-binding protein [Candidatus Cloacimonetes bacterium]|nr:ABC transporter ATP-binding protein [Candidatus Cloacimonadota bacterium]HEX37656.1 ABC transporter ATP-binding protein [Candidatus Cloacimonadota bacterium]